MKKIILALLFIITTFGVVMSMANEKFTLTSTTFKDSTFLADEQVYNGHGCTGKNISPELTWTNAPDGTKSYALVVHDPDAPIQGGWYHWVVVNMPSSKTSLQKGEQISAPALSCKTSFNTTGYGGPCPPVRHGKHRYIFTIYAVDSQNLPVEQGFSPDKTESVIKQHALASASITGYYERK